MIDTIPCPDCHGEGKSIASHVRYADGSGTWNVLLPCIACQGKGRVAARTPAWKLAGEACRRKRLADYVNMHKIGQRFGLSTVQVSQMEHGKIDPTPLVEAWEREEGKP